MVGAELAGLSLQPLPDTLPWSLERGGCASSPFDTPSSGGMTGPGARAEGSLESDSSVGPTSTTGCPWWWRMGEVWYLAKLARLYEVELGLNFNKSRRGPPIDYVSTVDRRPITAVENIPGWAREIASSEHDALFKTFDTITVKNVMGAENAFILRKHQRLVVWDADGLPLLFLEPPKRRPMLSFMTLLPEGATLTVTPPEHSAGCQLVYDAAGRLLPHIHTAACGFEWTQDVPLLAAAPAPLMVALAAAVVGAWYSDLCTPGFASDSGDEETEESEDAAPARHHDPTQGGIISSQSFDDLQREDSLDGDLEWDSDDGGDIPREFSADEINDFPELFFSPLP
eukprot:TRINITY_DN9314_c1_g3_i1.p1 TRINITY_DN9314_c1_g3~~TRINITY_DN9314_c1_g3_i1.p1  ORF type:complete len:342 (+),score=125.30 TRINITY_DN9314_c1_g3_i1:123-1148(+)